MADKIIKVCSGKSCSGRFSEYIKKRLEADRDFYGYPDWVKIESCLCQGRCSEWPTVVFDTETETRQNPVKSSELLRKKIGEWKKQYSSRKK